ncbi:hypothetical protein CCMA1212_007718 [Trichoderma ghanense]|uniref:Uncharacterized protein n=1 Tax=Trichoderma ghanense TaxID=65468 RepID=A0ABY2GYW5_9HYPO
MLRNSASLPKAASGHDVQNLVGMTASDGVSQQLFDSGTRIQGQVGRTKGPTLYNCEAPEAVPPNLEIPSLQLQPCSSLEPSTVPSAARLSAESLPQLRSGSEHAWLRHS